MENSKPIYVTYTAEQDPVEVLESAIRKHGDKEAFILIPSSLWARWENSNKGR